MPSLTIVIPYYDDIAEATGIISAIAAQLREPKSVEWFLPEVDPDQAGDGRLTTSLPESARLLPAAAFRGLPAAKNAGLKAASADLLQSQPAVFGDGGVERGQDIKPQPETLLRPHRMGI